MPSFAPDSLFNPQPGAPTLIYGIVGVVYLVLLAASIYVYARPPFGGHRVKTKLAQKAAIIGIVLGALGVLLVLLRYLQVPVLSARILLYLLGLVSLALLGYFIYYLNTRYPARMAQHDAEELRRRYMPRPKSKPAAVPSRLAHARKKGKKHR